MMLNEVTRSYMKSYEVVNDVKLRFMKLKMKLEGVRKSKRWKLSKVWTKVHKTSKIWVKSEQQSHRGKSAQNTDKHL